MLYPNRDKELSSKDFKNPGSEYRAAPFWAWNNKLDKDELIWQIERLKELGYGGFHMHVRTGMATEYLSDEYMDIVKACVEKAREEKMLAWLYDEDRWPSGFAGGIVTKNPKHRIQHLLLTRSPYGSPAKPNTERRARGDQVCRYENGELKACFDILLDTNGDLLSYKTINENEKAQGIKLYAYLESSHSIPWFANQAYVNTLDPGAIAEFIKVTYGTYEKHFKKDFGSLIPAIFTDEPQFSQKGTLNFAQEEKDITLPWTHDLEESFMSAYNGASLIQSIPELLWDLPEGKVSLSRYHYHDHLAERFAAAFADQCGSWCREQGIMLTGHMMEEPTLESQTHALGEAMRSFRSFQLPGIDMLNDRHEFTTAKQAQSAARQNGVPGTMSEIYGVTNWNFDFRGHKLQGDWQAALGVMVRVPHLSWVSMNGEAKRDYPSTFNYQSPWYREYPYIENHFARVALAMTRGRPVCRIGVLHPIESYWLYWGTRENTAAIRGLMNNRFIDLCSWLLKGAIDFDYICESTLPHYCKTSGITGPEFPVGEMKYDVIVVPALETIRKSSIERLEAFKKAGGRIIFLGDAPKYMDAIPSERGKILYDSSEKIGFEQLPILAALENVRELDIRDSSGSQTQDIIYQLREEADGKRWLFIAQAENPENQDLPRGRIIRLRVRGEWAAVLYDTVNGEITPISVKHEKGWTLITRPLYEHDSLLIKLDKSSPLFSDAEPVLLTNTTGYDGRSTSSLLPKSLYFTGTVPVTLEEPNVLLLDMAEYALDTEDYRPREEILRLDNILRNELKWPVRGDAWAQPWVEPDTSRPHSLRLRFSFESEIALTGAELAMEDALNAKVTLNGKAAGKVTGWYVDKCIGKISLPEITKGKNILEISFPYGRKVNVEAVYLLGDFGVTVFGSFCTLTEAPLTLAFGDITRQGLPFYGGNIIYHLDADIPKDKFTIQATQYRGHLLKVRVDGKDYGPLVYSPYQMEIPAAKGRHKIDMIFYGSRINTFGQLHSVERRMSFWWGPNSWRTLGANWSYEYQFWPQGILKSPQIVFD